MLQVFQWSILPARKKNTGSFHLFSNIFHVLYIEQSGGFMPRINRSRTLPTIWTNEDNPDVCMHHLLSEYIVLVKDDINERENRSIDMLRYLTPAVSRKVGICTTSAYFA